MADNANKSNEDEYHFSELESSDIYGSAAQPIKEQENRFKPIRRIIFIVAVLAVMFAIYKLSGVLMNKNVSQPPQPQKASNLPTTQLQPAVSPGIASVADSAIASLEKRSESTQSTLTQLGNDVNGLKTSMSDLQQSITSLQSSLQDLTSQLQQQATQIKTQEELLIKLQPHKPVRKIAKKSIKRANYYVEAMIPGRAWLQSPGGYALTISVGDQIAGYSGVVENIDPHAGTVTMSSGTIITYRPNDR